MNVKTSIGTLSMNKRNLNLLAIMLGEYGKLKGEIATGVAEKVSEEIYTELAKTGYYNRED